MLQSETDIVGRSCTYSTTVADLMFYNGLMTSAGHSSAAQDQQLACVLALIVHHRMASLTVRTDHRIAVSAGACVDVQYLSSAGQWYRRSAFTLSVIIGFIPNTADF